MQTKRDLVVQMADALAVPQSQTALLVDTYARVVACALAAGEPAVLPGLGRLIIKEIPAHTARNPKTGATIQVPPSRRVRFKPSQSLSQMVEVGHG